MTDIRPCRSDILLQAAVELRRRHEVFGFDSVTVRGSRRKNSAR